MTAPWWGKEASPSQVARIVRAKGPARTQPELASASLAAVVAEVNQCIESFTPEWTNRKTSDPGVALVRLFGEQTEPVLKRLNRLPEKAFVEFLSIAGIQPLPATAARTLLEFEVSDGASQSILVTRGFQVGAQPATGEGDLVVFETERVLFAAPAKIAEMFVKDGTEFLEIDAKSQGEETPFLAFGKKAGPGSALLIGLSGSVVPGPSISLGVSVAAPPGAPPPVSAGGVSPLPIAPGPLLRWEVLDGTSFQSADIVIDETAGLARTGVIELDVPRRWRTGRPDGLEGDQQLRWLRLRILHGEFAESPALSFVRLNMVSASATRTIRNEVLEAVPGTGGRKMQLSQTPVVPGSQILEVDEGEVAQITTAPDEATGTESRRWKEVSELASSGPDDKVYVLDPATGVVSFGDGVRGAAAPPGFRNVRAISYQVGGGLAGRVEAEEVSTTLSSVAFIKGVSNPLPASGGADTESQLDAMKRGPQEIRARGRAVTVADYELMAKRVDGADVKRAHAVSGFHASFPGLPIPGVLTVFVVSSDRSEGPPTPDQGTLRAVVEQLSKELAPAGVEVVAAAPRFHNVRVEVGIAVDPAADAAGTVRKVLELLDTYLDPLRGGDAGEGWVFGGALKYVPLLRQITSVEGVTAAPRLNLVIDGIRIASCTDFATAPHALLWPAGHQVVVREVQESV
jgi:predicted phage baseplate assembly protein